ncbi:VCBS repeat-containing protein [Pelagicoccus sp. SDUM812002]|uniref:FG-GAP repeat domain-containing protein n=1 Tax=Pelagicoccus sp. SDUM812002 TaxID=3041266 RepID=UPI002810284D|nr:VCBS repeat-containing protein [Pelagicoccus sp. SDUM812002]MDQ8188227.1 VCBS repeat-containing protein [Pelagicoccus sp. SDUM812002]
MDFDQNGWLDIYIVRHKLEDLIYLNESESFTKIINPLGLETNDGGNVTAWANVDNDSDKDMIVGVADAREHLLYLTDVRRNIH